MWRAKSVSIPRSLECQGVSPSRPPSTRASKSDSHRSSHFWSSNMAHTFWSRRSVLPSPFPVRDISLFCLISVLATLIVVASLLLVITLLLGLRARDRDSRTKVQVLLTGFIKIEGIVVFVENIEVFAFLGIRYARLPTSNGRFQPPVPLDAPELSTIDATEFGPSCIQKGRNGSEECLTLNIWTPKLNCAHGSEECGNRTVLFFLHGGFFQFGGNAEYDGRFLSASGNLVVVVPNYRLGVLGFLELDAKEAPGDMGLMDQTEAFVWTRDNIRMFGGNPNNIVLMGHESGAKSIGFSLYKSHRVWGVKKVILLSGSAYTRYPHQANSTKHRLFEAVSCPMNRDKALACLKALPATIYASTSRVPYFFPNFNTTVTDFTEASAYVPDITDVLIGYVEDEGTYLVSSYLGAFIKQIQAVIEEGSVHAVVYMLTRIGFNRSKAMAVVEEYVAGSGGSRHSWIEELAMDVIVVCPLLQHAADLASAGNRVLTYYVGRENSAVSRVQHGQITGLLFGSNIQSPEEKILSRRVIKFFADFANGDSHLPRVNITGAGYSIVFIPFEQTVNDTSGFNARRGHCDHLGRF